MPAKVDFLRPKTMSKPFRNKSIQLEKSEKRLLIRKIVQNLISFFSKSSSFWFILDKRALILPC